MSRHALPPLSSLRAFEAAARLGSFRDAGAELGVTPSAISHQISILEQWVGAPLFTRLVRAVQLTEAGRRLSGDVGAAFERLEAALTRARSGARDARLKLSTLPLFTSVWLTPRLSRFHALHPELSIEIDTSNRLADFAMDDVDVAIRNIYAPTPGLSARKLLDLHAAPMCAPPLARTLRSPDDLAHVTLIHISARKAGWAEWLGAAGCKGLKPKANLSFDTIPAALEAAAQERGVLLGLMPLVWDSPAARELVTPFKGPILSAGSYFAVYRREDRDRVVVRAFVDWIVKEMRADLRRLQRASRFS